MTRTEFLVSLLYTVIYHYIFDYAWHAHWLSAFTAVLIYPLGLGVIWGRIWTRRLGLGWFRGTLLPEKDYRKGD
jgi:hypothetical protein